MTPTEQWIFCLALVYSVPSFLGGVGITLLIVRWPSVRRAAATMPRFLSPKLTFERRDRIEASNGPGQEIRRVPDAVRAG
jgi:hypothetical protein